MNRAALDAITDKVLAHGASDKRPLKVIAGEPGSPLVIGEIEIPCYVLEDETRVLSQGGFLQAIGRSRTPKAGTGGGVDDLPAFLNASNLKPYLSQIREGMSTTPILFQMPRGLKGYGYKAQLLPEVCSVYLEAKSDGALLPSQLHIAERAEILIRGLAIVGIIGLVDEATGYQRIREQRALAAILERFLDEELQPWTRTFEFSFYEQIFRLKGWGNAEGMKRPQVIGHYTNDLVYHRIAPGVLAELRERNPVLPQGWRKDRHHQWFTPEFGHPKLLQHIEGVTALMRAASSWESFKRALDRAYPKSGTQFAMPTDED
jgi:hypothetical protein